MSDNPTSFRHLFGHYIRQPTKTREGSPPQKMDLLERGVYEAPFLSTAGTRLAIGVTSAGRFVGFLPFATEAEGTAAFRALWALLDEADPVPLLRAV
jgi:hypothetical protein